MHFHVVTIFPHALDSYIHESIIGRAIESGAISVSFYDPREYAVKENGRIDQKPYGGGPGMVLQAEPFISATLVALESIPEGRRVKIIFFARGGEQLSDTTVEGLAGSYDDIVMIAGHYEGVDARVIPALENKEKNYEIDKVSIGEFTLTGGELPAAVLIDAVSRLVPGVLGNMDSLEDSRVSSSDVYTRPEVFEVDGKAYAVPEVLLSGHHKNIDEWRAENREKNK